MDSDWSRTAGESLRRRPAPVPPPSGRSRTCPAREERKHQPWKHRPPSSEQSISPRCRCPSRSRLANVCSLASESSAGRPSARGNDRRAWRRSARAWRWSAWARRRPWQRSWQRLRQGSWRLRRSWRLWKVRKESLTRKRRPRRLWKVPPRSQPEPTAARRRDPPRGSSRAAARRRLRRSCVQAVVSSRPLGVRQLR